MVRSACDPERKGIPMALMREWAHTSTSANSAGSAISMAARDGLMDDVARKAAAWYFANLDRQFAKWRVLRWTIRVAVKGVSIDGPFVHKSYPLALMLFREMFGDDFSTVVPTPAEVT